MPSVTIAPQSDAATWSSGIAAGAGLHLPAGTYGGATYRSAMRFTAPSGWQGWTGITKATLSFYISDFDHVAPRNSSIYCRRQSTSLLWDTLAEGTQNCESGFSGSNTTQYTDIQGTSTDQLTFSSGTTANAKKSLTVTAMVQYYWDNDVARMVFVFERVGSSDYTELWSRNKSGYEASLTIDYEDNTVPTAPTLTAPNSGATVNDTTPLLDWTHNDPQGDPQASAEVRVWNSTGGTQVGTTQTVVGATSSLAWPNVLVRGTTYQFDVRTADALGYGPWSSKRSFTILANPVTTVTATRFMEFSGGAPRLRVKWTHTGGAQTHYRVQAGAYDSGTVASTAKELLLSSLALTNGTAVTVTVTVTTTDGLSDADSQDFTPRWGLTTHRKDMGTAPVAWGTPAVSQTVPTGASLVIEYASSATASATPSPNTWFSSLSSVSKQRYLFHRVWLIPSSSAGPTLSKLTVPVDFAVQTVDHWYADYVGGALAAPWSVDTGEYVYGTRSITRDGNGIVGAALSAPIKLRAGRSYILTGLMKSEGNSGAMFSLYDDTTVMLSPSGEAINSEMLTASRDWFEASQYDVYRYRTPVFVAPTDMEVFVRLRMNGAAGTAAWWDAIKLEESTVATPWGPSAVGAVSIDAGGVQVDGSKGGVFRLRSSTGKTMELSSVGLYGDGEVAMTGAGTTAYASDTEPGRTGSYQFLINKTGQLNWGAGAGVARDTNLYRGAANLLKTDDSFETGGNVVVGGRLSLGNLIQPTLAANVNDWDPTGFSTASVLRISSSGAFSISGMAAGAQGDIVLLYNNHSTNSITLLNNSTASVAGNRMLIGGGNFIIPPRGTVMLVYNTTQGAWLFVMG